MRHRIVRVALVGAFLVGFGIATAPVVAGETGADLAISMAGPTRVKSTGFYDYIITVRNLGPVTATNISIIAGGGDQIDEVSVQCQDNGSIGQSECHPNDLPAGASVTATYTLKVCCLVRHEDRHAEVGASVGQDLAPPDPNLDNNTAQIDIFITGKQVRFR